MSSAMSHWLENIAAVLLGALLAWAVTTWMQRDDVDPVASVTRDVNSHAATPASRVLTP